MVNIINSLLGQKDKDIANSQQWSAADSKDDQSERSGKEICRALAKVHDGNQPS